jgi:hypothetical protein|tara:strand:+ start:64138 stop:64806 length:669 start_codon:yes stop_codon:yes gene_type:complete
MADFSSAKFSKNSKEPAFLPDRLRLPDGFTRYKWSITQEEVESCGYVGPIVDPDRSTGQEYIWVEGSGWVAHGDPKPLSSKQKVSTNARLRNDLGLVLAGEYVKMKEIKDAGYLPAYRQAWQDYFFSLKELLESSGLIATSDVPAAPCEGEYFKTEEELKAAYKVFYDQDFQNLRFEYEKYGVISGLRKEFATLFAPDPSWVKGTQAVPEDHDTIIIDYRDL